LVGDAEMSEHLIDKTTAQLLYDLGYILERMLWVHSWDNNDERDESEKQDITDLKDMVEIVATLERRNKDDVI
jgi:hypothetical protein